MAEAIVAREEALSQRVFDPAFRTKATELLATRPLAELLAQPGDVGLGLNSLGDSQADLVYTPVTPCRIIDTRRAGGALAAGQPRNFLVTGSDYSAQGGGATSCGVPYGSTTAVIVNFVAVNSAGQGNLRVTPFGTPMPLASIINYALPGTGLNLANGLAVATCNPSAATCSSDITIQADGSGADLVADVQGYFRRVSTGGVGTALLADGAVTGPKIAAGAAVRSLNAQTDAVTLAGANGLSVTAGAGTVTVTSSATSANAPSTLVSRDGSGNFSAGTITANLSGTATNATTVAGLSCAPGQVPKWSGGVWACGVDVSGGTVTLVGTGAGLAGGPISTTGTVSVATGGITSSMIANGSVGTAQINPTQVQARLTGACGPGGAIQGVDQNGNVACGSGTGLSMQLVATLRWDQLPRAYGDFPVGTQPTGMAFDGANVWVTNSANNNVTKLRASDGTSLGTFAVGTSPYALAFDGANMWVGNYTSNNVSKVRTSDGALLGTFAAGAGPYSVAFDGTNIWVANYDSNNVTKLRASDGASLGTFAVGTQPIGVAFDGANIWVTNYGSNNVTRLRASDGAGLGTFALGSGPWGVAFDGANIWVANNGSTTVTKLRASDGASLGTFSVGAQPAGVIFDGANIWVTNPSTNNVTRLRASDGASLGAIPVGTQPYAVAFDGAHVWVANFSSGTVSKR